MYVCNLTNISPLQFAYVDKVGWHVSLSCHQGIECQCKPAGLVISSSYNRSVGFVTRTRQKVEVTFTFYPCHKPSSATTTECINRWVRTRAGIERTRACCGWERSIVSVVRGTCVCAAVWSWIRRGRTRNHNENRNTHGQCAHEIPRRRPRILFVYQR